MWVPKVVIVVAYLLGRSDVLGPAAVQVLSRLAFFVASPALLFVTLAHADVGAVFFEALLVTAVTSSVACLLYLPVGLLRRRPPGGDRGGRDGQRVRERGATSVFRSRPTPSATPPRWRP
jgi:predicted permease